MLPRLDGRSLGRLACTCKAGAELVSLASAEVWQTAAAHVLTSRHPVCSSKEIPEIREALNDYATSRANLRQGHVQCQLHVLKVVGLPAFAPNSSDFAAMVAGYTGNAATHIYNLDEDDFDYADESDLCLMVFQEDRSKIPLLMVPWSSSSNHMDWAWSRNGQSTVYLDIQDFNEDELVLRVVMTQVHTGHSNPTSITLPNMPDEDDIVLRLSAYGEAIACLVFSDHDSSAMIADVHSDGELRVHNVLSNESKDIFCCFYLNPSLDVADPEELVMISWIGGWSAGNLY
ncbi:hypothetical protein WJX73_001298 [Symbiochloris irregularis]|uniref:Uncharacterized protein n=1 Tax=Symbiochloris irregularis TaxID=706552 RepID=A0AAW1NPT9_9CHLO